MAFLAALLMSVLVSANYLLHRDVLYPAFLQASLWFVAVSLFLVWQGAFVPVSDRVFILLTLGVVLFSMGGFLASYGHRPHLVRNYLREGTLPSNRATAVLSAAVVLGLILYVSRAWELASTGPTSNWFINLRYAVSVNEAETGGFGAAAYFIPLSYVLAAIFILKRYGFASPTASRTLVWVCLVVGCIFGALWAARSTLLPLIVMAVIIPASLRATKPAKAGAMLVVLSVLLFALVGLAVGKGGSFSRGLSENWPTMRESFLTYAVGSIPALNAFLDNQGPDMDVGVNSLRSIFAVLRALGFQASAAPLVQPWVDVPTPTNVYTVYQPYVKDFGPLGGIAVLFVLGFLHAVLYRRATVRNPHAISVFLFALSLFPLVMQVFQDMYFSLLSLWIQYGAYAVVLFVVVNERPGRSRFRSTPSPELGPVASHL